MIVSSHAQWPVSFGQGYYWAGVNNIREHYDKGFLVQYDFQYYGEWNSSIMKININGEKLWNKAIESDSPFLQIRGIATCDDGGIIITGRTLELDNLPDPFVMRLNACGEPVWCNIYSTPAIEDIANEVLYLTDDNSCIVDFYSLGMENVYIRKIDSIGNTVWKNVFMNSDSIYVSAFTEGLTLSEFDSTFIQHGFVYVIDSLIYTVTPYWSKINYDGQLMWETFYLSDTINMGFSQRRPMIFEDTIIAPAYTPEYSGSKAVKLDNDGTVISIFPLIQADSVIDLLINSSGLLNNHLFFGVQNFEASSGGIGFASLQKYNLNGNYSGETRLPVDFTAFIDDICVTSDNKILLSSYLDLELPGFMLIKYNESLQYDTVINTQLTYDYMCDHTITSDEIPFNCNIITDTDVIDIKKIPALIISPNPSNNYAVIRLPELILTDIFESTIMVNSYRSDYARDLLCEIYDLNGDMLKSFHLTDGLKEHVINVSSFAEGVYLLRITKNGVLISSGKMIKV